MIYPDLITRWFFSQYQDKNYVTIEVTHVIIFPSSNLANYKNMYEIQCDSMRNKYLRHVYLNESSL